MRQEVIGILHQSGSMMSRKLENRDDAFPSDQKSPLTRRPSVGKSDEYEYSMSETLQFRHEIVANKRYITLSQDELDHLATLSSVRPRIHTQC